MKFYNIVALLMGCMTLSHGAAVGVLDSSDSSVDDHLHRIMARYTLSPSTFTHKDLSLSVYALFAAAESEGNVAKMTAIINFFKQEDVIPSDLSEFKVRLFQKMSAEKLKCSYFRSAFNKVS